MRVPNLAALSIGLSTLLTPAYAAAQSGVLPPVVVADLNGDPIGPVVGFQDANSPIIRVMDTAMDLPVFLRVRDDGWLQTSVSTTFFGGDTCTGTVYHPSSPQTESGLYALMGFAYSVARLGAGNQAVYRSNLSTAAGSVSILSTFNASNACDDTDLGLLTVRTATFVLDLDAAHPPPYQVNP
jgi:hypothetical protein